MNEDPPLVTSLSVKTTTALYALFLKQGLLAAVLAAKATTVGVTTQSIRLCLPNFRSLSLSFLDLKRSRGWKTSTTRNCLTTSTNLLRKLRLLSKLESTSSSAARDHLHLKKRTVYLVTLTLSRLTNDYLAVTIIDQVKNCQTQSSTNLMTVQETPMRIRSNH